MLRALLDGPTMLHILPLGATGARSRRSLPGKPWTAQQPPGGQTAAQAAEQASFPGDGASRGGFVSGLRASLGGVFEGAEARARAFFSRPGAGPAPVLGYGLVARARALPTSQLLAALLAVVLCMSSCVAYLVSDLLRDYRQLGPREYL